MCCKWWEYAQQLGTDNEPYGAAIYVHGGAYASIGVVPEPLHYCPWCGAPKDREPFDLDVEPPGIEME
jgi:hypothetical protein